MRILVCLIVITLFVSCASKDELPNYETYNDQFEQSPVEKQNGKLVTDFKNVPQHKNLREKVSPGFLFYLNHLNQVHRVHLSLFQLEYLF